MVDREEENLRNLRKRTIDLHENKISNAQSISKHEQLERTLHEIDMKERNIVNRLFESWKKDRGFLVQLDQVFMELDDHKRVVHREVNAQQRGLFQEKRRLDRLEDELIREKVMRKGE
ncbi:MAG TPA: hypothetical protein VK144_06260 [Bacillota bacterium]|nr:hypothetical protein [Bacillota bacterium]